MADERKAIEETIQTYFDGLYQGDIEKLARAFHPTSALTWEEKGEIKVLPRDRWFELVRGRASPQAKGLARDDGILSIDQSSPTTAFVKVKCQMPPRYFQDYLSLLKIDGRWQVVQKVYMVEMREDAATANAA